MASLLHLYNPAVRSADQAATWDCLKLLNWPGTITIWHRSCPDPLDMAQWLNYHWDDAGDLVIFEQDIIAGPWHVAELRACPQPVCAFDYPLSNGVPWTEVPGGTGLGLWKATKDARTSVVATPPVPWVPWHDLGDELRKRVGESHVHRPLIGHNHKAE